MQGIDRNTNIALFWPNFSAKFLMRILSQATFVDTNLAIDIRGADFWVGSNLPEQP